ncbi:hypothetical protein FQZ97_1095230 [compost metagenome]
MLPPARACSAAVVAVLVAPPVTSMRLSLREMDAPSSARAALALEPAARMATSVALIALPTPVASSPWLRLKAFSLSSGVALDTPAPLVLTSCPRSSTLAPLRDQMPTAPLPEVTTPPPITWAWLPAPSTSRPWP